MANQFKKTDVPYIFLNLFFKKLVSQVSLSLPSLWLLRQFPRLPSLAQNITLLLRDVGGTTTWCECVCVCLVRRRHFATRIQRISLPHQRQREQNQAFVCFLLLFFYDAMGGGGAERKSPLARKKDVSCENFAPIFPPCY